MSKTIQNATTTVKILREVAFRVPRGQFLAIMGASGSGKSTLLGLLAGLDTVTSGRVVLDGEDITDLKEDQLASLRGRKIGFVFQSYQLVPTLTAKENILLPAELTGLRGDWESRATELLERVGLSNRGHHYPVQLSGGEQQRVALARAFIIKPPILMADEPTGNLDSQNGQHVLDLLLQMNREERTTLILVTHDRKLADYADRIITLCDGQVQSDELTCADGGRIEVFTGTAAKIAWRELRASPAKFLFVIVAVAVGVGALSGVKGFGSAFKGMLLRNAKQLIAADLQAQTYQDPSPEAVHKVERIGARDGQVTRVTETISMAVAGHNRVPQMVSVKAVDPRQYPFYGKLTVDPNRPLKDLLTNDTVVVSPELLLRMRTRRG